jgi:hypothetical protein
MNGVVSAMDVSDVLDPLRIFRLDSRVPVSEQLVEFYFYSCFVCRLDFVVVFVNV